MQYSVGFDLDERVRTAIGQTPEQVWEAALDAAGKAREDAQVAEGDRAAAAQYRRRPARHLAGRDADPGAVRREEIETGAQLWLFEQANGYR